MDSRNKHTTREREIFELVRKGLRSHEIAQQLFIADSTVYKHIQNILDKLNVRNRTQALIVSESSGK
jgi:two-component system, NarL family, nitrate/nitrite response regulator NarL